MFLISNNCLAGFIYRDILKTKYTSPFIWTGIHPDDYIQIIDEFDKIDLTDIELVKEKDGLSNNFDILIYGKYHVHNHHMWFDKDAKIPSTFGPNNCDIKYYKIWEYIFNNWIRRAKRCKLENKKLFLFYDNFNLSKNPYKLTDVMQRHPEYMCIAFTDKNIKALNNLIIKKINLSWGSEPGGWYNSFMKTHKIFLENYLKNYE
jgi:uncharacterized protein (DUF1919 family)